MPTDDERADKPTDSDRRTDDGTHGDSGSATGTATDGEELPTAPLLHVDVPPETAREAARLADEYGIAMEDALVRLTAFDYPASEIPKPPGDTEGNRGP